MRRPGLVIGAALAVVVFLGVVVVAAVDTDDTTTVSYLEAERFPEDDGSPDRAMAVCQEHGPAVGRMTLAHASSTTAGDVVDVMRALGRPTGPWDTFPDDHYVARCSYLDLQISSPPPTLCPDGKTVETEPVQFLVDDQGTVTPDIPPPHTDYCGD